MDDKDLSGLSNEAFGPNQIRFLYLSPRMVETSLKLAATGRLSFEAELAFAPPGQSERHVATVLSGRVRNEDGSEQTVIYNYNASTADGHLQPADAKLVWSGKRSNIISYEHVVVEHSDNLKSIEHNRGLAHTPLGL